MRFRQFGIVIAFGVTAVLCAAQSGSQSQGAKQQQQQQSEKPAEPAAPSASPAEAPKAGAIAAVDPKTFQIGAEDVIYVQVWREPDFSRQVMVRPDGKITMPLIGDIQATGITPDQLSTNITEALTKYLNNPQVFITVVQVNSKKYYITGEVNRPGAFPLVVPTRVLEALTNAGGFRDFANTKKIVVLRKGQRLKFNYNDVVKGKNLDQNIFIEPGDYIIVP